MNSKRKSNIYKEIYARQNHSWICESPLFSYTEPINLSESQQWFRYLQEPLSVMKFLFLIPPSEGKNPGGIIDMEEVTHTYQKPLYIATNATMNDLKCTGPRYIEAKTLNTMISEGPFMKAIERYD